MCWLFSKRPKFLIFYANLVDSEQQKLNFFGEADNHGAKTNKSFNQKHPSFLFYWKFQNHL